MRSDRLYLADMLDAITAVERFTDGVGEGDFLASEMLQSAVLQKLSVIGEAAARLSANARNEAGDAPWKESLQNRTADRRLVETERNWAASVANYQSVYARLVDKCSAV